LCNGTLRLTVQLELKAKKEEHDRWRNVPDWKKRLIMDKEKKKQQEMVRLKQMSDFDLYSVVDFAIVPKVHIFFVTDN